MREKGHFLRICDFPPDRLDAIVKRGIALKKERNDGKVSNALEGKVMAMLFLKPSTRTRVSFESGMAQLGGSTVFLDPGTLQMSRGESAADTAKVLSSMCDVVVVRTHAHGMLDEIAAVSSVPVVNALSEQEHPCQVLADIMTFTEAREEIKEKKIAWIGDCNNVCKSWMNAAAPFGFDLAVACPAAYALDEGKQAGLKNVTFTLDPQEAAKDAACIVTDVWYSMGDEDDRQRRMEAFKGYTVDAAVMAKALPDAIFMHCLPAHRGEEVAPDVIDGDQSAVWAEAENRMHVQKALLEDMLA